ncbi:MAG: Gfo/Idh/MocA family oxidoreductase [Granulosicoccus sp.]|nr:Gfo/Idh/MocA family oxidoreductase [Granulosicoccus sp.]
MKPLNWGLIGGGKGSQIGDAHRIGSSMDGCFSLAAGALDIDAAKGKRYARELGVAPDRAYGTWQEMLEGERSRDDGIQLVTVATPNATHYEIAKAFLEAGIHVLCEKPLTMSVKDANALQKLAKRQDRLLAVNFGYTGYPLVRQMRAMVESGKLGAIRLVFAQFAHGHHADAADMENPRVRWRYDPSQAGVSSVLADCGIHALQMATYIVDQSIESLSADFLSGVEGRELEDDAALQLKLSAGTTCRLWSSAIALGHMHGLAIEIFGEKGGLRWHQEQPNQLYFTPLNKHTQIIERGAQGLYPAARAASRIAIGHPEGMLPAFANIYSDLRAAINGDNKALDRLPMVDAGVEMVKVVDAAARSAKNGGKRITLK